MDESVPVQDPVYQTSKALEQALVCTQFALVVSNLHDPTVFSARLSAVCLLSSFLTRKIYLAPA